MSRVIVEESDALVIDLGKSYSSLSTSGCPKVYGGIRYIGFKRVPKNFEHVDLNNFCRETSRSLGIDIEESAIFLTAVDLKKYSRGSSSYKGVEAEAFVTYGVDSPSCFEGAEKWKFGTINVAVIVDEPLSDVGLLDLFRTVSEVKGMIMSLGGPMCYSSSSVGTPSDATMVASPFGGERFAGSATDVGISASLAVLRALSEQIRNAPVDEHTAKTLGFKDIDEVVKLAVRAYRKAPIPFLSELDAEEEIKEEIDSILKDPNLRIIIRSARLAESFLSFGLLPGIEAEEYSSDSSGIIADEVMGKAIAEYLNGFKGLLAYYWIDRIKEGDKDLEDLSGLPPMTDDVVGAIVGGVLSRIYDKYSRK
ncbi:adenosylcobinamide amidohydrolase [Fervidicoccus fontis]|uniref:Adenosylcobinamide amidohydrolase n=1 Tax=Fervidicoccus fontis TaxID=683846 RepID=A0A843AGN8_9CREN|nr:phosphatidylglycerophosphatase A [Fervidicoccus fontis]MBE9390769.1 adenosylcobinamide amidohydrolase [Fervidicoccus fontis]PNV81587.1 MAG: hypothetical protein C0179_01925 [Fervidicoccus sp.]